MNEEKKPEPEVVESPSSNEPKPTLETIPIEPVKNEPPIQKIQETPPTPIPKIGTAEPSQDSAKLTLPENVTETGKPPFFKPWVRDLFRKS